MPRKVRGVIDVAEEDQKQHWSRTFHVHKDTWEALERRSKCGRSPSGTHRVVIERYVHLMSVGRERLSRKSITDAVIQTLAEQLRWQPLDSILVILRLPDTLRTLGVEDSVAAALGSLDDLELVALSDAIELMFSRYQVK